MTRKLKAVTFEVDNESIKVTNPKETLIAEAKSGKYVYLLAHADDGVIWGRIEGEELVYSTDAFPDVSPKLRSQTLQQARLFGPQAELFLWREDSKERGWRARVVTEGNGTQAEAYDEALILWGTDAEGSEAGFTLYREADLGIRHAPPLKLDGRRRRTLRLITRHYVDFDDEGAAFVKLSRLVDLSNEVSDDSQA